MDGQMVSSGDKLLRTLTSGVIVLVLGGVIYTLWIVLANFRNIGV